VATRSRPRAPRSTRDITARQREVLGLIALGLTNKEMAHSLGITERGAAAHVSRLLARFSVPNRAGLISRTLSEALSLPVLLERELEAYSSSTFMIGLTIGPDNVLVYANAAGEKMYGIGRESGTGSRFTTRRESPGTNAFREGARRAYRTGRATTVEQQQARWLRDDGTWSTGHFSCVLQPVREAIGSVFGVLWICMPSVEAQPAR
jgi:DNA-binding CsgD family transcriptional regulator